EVRSQFRLFYMKWRRVPVTTQQISWKKCPILSNFVVTVIILNFIEFKLLDYTSQINIFDIFDKILKNS
ncbi:MAG: hypothetical protein ACTSRG_12655, partial [Candidatus Helarchaeota archaeon]